MALKWNVEGFRCSQCDRVLVPSRIETVQGTFGEIVTTSG